MTLPNILALNLLGSVAGLIGGVFFLLNHKYARILSRYAVPFAAGVLLGTALLDLLPESVENIGSNGYLVVLISFLCSFLLEECIAHLHHHQDREHTVKHHASVSLVIVGDTIHNFIDGVSITAAYFVSPSMGMIIALATFLHETPHEIGDFGVLMSKGWSRTKTFWANLYSSLSTFLGAFFVYFIAKDSSSLIGILLGISAGIFLYLGASDFVPEIGEEKTGIPAWKKFSLLILGSLIMYLMTSYIEHGH